MNPLLSKERKKGKHIILCIPYRNNQVRLFRIENLKLSHMKGHCTCMLAWAQTAGLCTSLFTYRLFHTFTIFVFVPRVSDTKCNQLDIFPHVFWLNAGTLQHFSLEPQIRRDQRSKPLYHTLPFLIYPLDSSSWFFLNRQYLPLFLSKIILFIMVNSSKFDRQTSQTAC